MQTIPMPSKGQSLPDRVVWTVGGGLIPFIPADPALPAPVQVTVTGRTHQGHVSSGLTPKADCMARLVARGVALSDAYRAAYGLQRDARVIANRAAGIAKAGRFAGVVAGYRKALEAERVQEVYGVQDFVMSRLVLESQTADSAAARIRATELLGKTEAMFTDVKRTERTLSKADAKSLKAQLEQRLMAALSRVSPALRASLSHDTGTVLSPMDAGNPAGQTVPIHSPPYGEQESLRSGDTIIQSRSGVLTARPESTPVTDLDETPGGAAHMDSGASEAVWDEFSGPLVTKTL